MLLPPPPFLCVPPPPRSPILIMKNFDIGRAILYERESHRQLRPPQYASILSHSRAHKCPFKCKFDFSKLLWGRLSSAVQGSAQAQVVIGVHQKYYGTCNRLRTKFRTLGEEDFKVGRDGGVGGVELDREGVRDVVFGRDNVGADNVGGEWCGNCVPWRIHARMGYPLTGLKAGRNLIGFPIIQHPFSISCAVDSFCCIKLTEGAPFEETSQRKFLRSLTDINHVHIKSRHSLTNEGFTDLNDACTKVSTLCFSFPRRLRCFASELLDARHGIMAPSLTGRALILEITYEVTELSRYG
ncbi:uncharacterized protein EV420DRAFT_1638778 [Desarmillaria tabescens]|uniref:Uncharacterized protein n=1 Tax=Armillaria tabescens TaxID=1929756 RepID=A0AA39NDY3_ARMTA|nr:uncharacterized protein EV420DRAFT_1638778 [Desarmillaria tabescens]KAK0463850.1 hypothetical protein EV420DRAFT_1638778 [Desarmillaria tabescens]